MSIESVQDSETGQQRPGSSSGMAHKTVRTLQPPVAMAAPHSQYSDMLLGDMGMMGCDVDAWSRPQQHQQQYAPQPQQYGFACPPAVLTRHTSMPVAMPRQQMAPVHFQQQQQPATSFAMGMPPTLSRHHSHGYVSVMQQQQQGFQTSMNVPMPPRQVHVNEMQHLLEISMGQQQPLQYQPQQRMMKPEPITSSAMNVEPIAFTPADNNTKMPMDDLDPLAYAEMLFRSPELDQFAHATVAANMKPTTKSPKSMATCKVAGCERRVRSKGFCKTHGGGRKCSIEGCKKSSQNGDFCIGHGGGKNSPTATKLAGGGLCRAHGGGKRCQAAGCPKGAQRGNFCATHGGFRNCKIEGCVRTDRGGGFCEVHRRGRLCKIEGCKKLSRNQGMCTMHIREEKQDINPSASVKAEPAAALAV
ncbi:WRKY transcription factor 19 [Phytophthora cinnamomi]|uniref:WRKY transcription factor 19 n=1 Tax=Phytophthora cinnamomi TaxID=4785 RepID=UPI003559F8E5|nr:WRKY transcription factor 19 [Phytophthora cinnamomi]